MEVVAMTSDAEPMGSGRREFVRLGIVLGVQFEWCGGIAA
jgi:hypothetical protein